MLDVCLLGTGGMMPLPGRRLTALMTRYNGSSLLIDCGEGTQVAIKEKGWTFKPIDAICFTHYHADHISGLPGLLLTMGNTDRREPLTMIGPKGLERVVNSLRVICPELPFPIVFHEVTAPEEVIEMNGYKITAFRVQHNITCYGYSLEISRKGKFDVERAKAQEIPIKCWNPLQKGETVTLDGKTYTPDMVLGPQIYPRQFFRCLLGTKPIIIPGLTNDLFQGRTIRFLKFSQKNQLIHHFTPD